MIEIFRYGKCIYARPNIENVDDMVEMMKAYNQCCPLKRE